MQPIYLDYNATTPVDPAVFEAMVPFLREHYGNPSSSHILGQRAHEAVETARSQVAKLVNADPDEILFTSGGTEASNHAIKGSVFARWTHGLTGWLSRLTGRTRGAHVITSAVEHPATAEPIAFLKRLGCRVTVLAVDGSGMVDPQDVKKAIAADTVLVSVMHSNNEVGTLMPIAEIGAITRSRGVLLHTDAAQSLGKVPVDVATLNVDLLTMAGHKLYAPKGVGALYVRRGIVLDRFMHGAGHEGGRRAGTENVPYVVGLGKACQLAAESQLQSTARLKELRDQLWNHLRKGLGDRILLNGPPDQRLPNTLNANFVGHIGAELLACTPGVAASTGSACHEGKVSQSPVLCAMGVAPEIGKGAVRLSVGRFTTQAEVDAAAECLLASARP